MKMRRIWMGACLFLLLSTRLVAYAQDASYDAWRSVSSEQFTDATLWNSDSYVRSATTVVDSTLIESTIEQYKLGNDGYMYVSVLWGPDHQDYFRYPYVFTPEPGGPVDPFGEIGVPGSGTFTPPLPPGGTFTAGAVDYGSIPPSPEPETYAMLLLGLALLGAIQRFSKRQ